MTFNIFWIVAAGIISIPAVVRPWLGVLGLVLIQIPLASSTEGLVGAELGFALLFLATLLGWAIKMAVTEGPSLPRSWFIPLILLFLTVCATSVLTARLNGIGFTAWIRGWYQFGAVAIFFPVATEFRSLDRRRLLGITYLFAASAICAMAIAFTLAGGGVLVLYADVAPINPLPSPLYLYGGALVVASVVAPAPRKKRWVGIALILHAWRFLINFRRQPLAIFVLLWPIMLITTWRRFRTRPAVRRRLPRIIGGAAISAGVAIGAIFLFYRDLIIFAFDEYGRRFTSAVLLTGLEVRWHTNMAALGEFVEHPAWGVGFGAPLTLIAFPSRWEITPGINVRSVEVGGIHSLYVYLLTHGGLIVFLPVIALLALGLSESYRALKTLDGWDYTLASSLFAIFGIIGVQGFLSVNGMKLETWFLIGIGAGLLSIWKNVGREADAM